VQLLCDAGIRSVQELFSIADENDEQRLSDIHGIGQKTARTLIDELKDGRLRQLVAHLQAQGLQFNEAEPSEDSEGAADTPFKGQVWVITGSFQEFQPRSRAAELITKLGGNVVGAISGSTTHLLAGSGAGSKYDKALERGMTVVNEEQFLAMLPEGGQAG
ncbi:MAG: DNA ligase (NAD(+)) LigA, partial [Spirochaetaceae bacterium]